MAGEVTPMGDEEIITLEQGWNEINETGVRPYIRRIETALDPSEFEKCSIKAETYMHVYDKVFKMCIQREPHNYSSALYRRYGEAITTYLQETVQPALHLSKTQNQISFLREWTLRWKYHKLLVQGLRSMFTYLDRFFVPNSEDRLSLREHGFNLFYQSLYLEFHLFIRDAILELISKERQDREQQDSELLREAIHVFVELGYYLPGKQLQLYIEHFETPFITASRVFYENQSQVWLGGSTCSEYLIKVEAALKEEQIRLEAYLHPSTAVKLLVAVRNEILKKHLDHLIDQSSGLNAMLEQEKRDDLKRMYELSVPIEENQGVEKIAATFSLHVKQIAYQYVEETLKQRKDGNLKKDPHLLIKKLIQLHSKYLRIVSDCFSSNSYLEKALREAFEDAINKDVSISTLLAKYVHSLLTKGSREVAQQLDSTLDHIVTMYGYIRDKDVFEEEYQQYLASRLLENKSGSHTAEKSMIAKLKRECGYHWTSKLESMFKDIQVSQDLVRKYHESSTMESEIELNVNICTMGRWPNANLPACVIPKELKPTSDHFRLFYTQEHSGKCLEWRMDKGEAEVLVRYPSGSSKLFVVTTFQLVILVLYNTKDTYTFSEILDITQIEQGLIESHLLSLAHPKLKILSKQPNTKKLTKTDTFSFNPSFKSDYYRVKVPQMKPIQSTTVNKGVSKEILTQRRHQIDAAVVRIMKTRQRLEHNQLLAEVIKQLQRFKPDANEIKKRIEHLIEQEYLERDEKDRRTYNYLA